jgi:hypothetical protein
MWWYSSVEPVHVAKYHIIGILAKICQQELKRGRERAQEHMLSPRMPRMHRGALQQCTTREPESGPILPYHFIEERTINMKKP